MNVSVIHYGAKFLKRDEINEFLVIHQYFSYQMLVLSIFLYANLSIVSLIKNLRHKVYHHSNIWR